jgi:hypothetical protein
MREEEGTGSTTGRGGEEETNKKCAKQVRREEA